MSTFIEKRFFPKKTLTPEDKNRLTKIITERLLGEPDIVFAYLHGSFVSEESFRDIDIGAYTSSEKSFDFESDLSYELSTITGCEIDLKVITRAPVAFQMAAIRDGKLLFTRDEQKRTDFMIEVGRRYGEYAHFRKIFMEAVGDKR